MSETYRKGDRIKVTYEGVVVQDHPSSRYISIGTHAYDLVRHTVSPDYASVAKLSDPLPTTPGSVIRRSLDSGGYVYRSLTAEGYWRTERDPLVAVRALPQDHYYLSNYEVVFDAGKDDGDD